jgi:hypothetical protein
MTTTTTTTTGWPRTSVPASTKPSGGAALGRRPGSSSTAGEQADESDLRWRANRAAAVDPAPLPNAPDPPRPGWQAPVSAEIQTSRAASMRRGRRVARSGAWSDFRAHAERSRAARAGSPPAGGSADDGGFAMRARAVRAVSPAAGGSADDGGFAVRAWRRDEASFSCRALAQRGRVDGCRGPRTTEDSPCAPGRTWEASFLPLRA